MVKTVGEASRFCVPTALALLTGFSRQAVVIGLRDKIRARNYDGGYQHSDYMYYLRALPKTLVELGETRTYHYAVPANRLENGLWIISGRTFPGSGGHCYLVWNSLIFDNNIVGVETKKTEYTVSRYTPVLRSRFNETMQKLLAPVRQKAA